MSSSHNPSAEYGVSSSALRRKEPRVRTAIAVRIWGMDTAGAPFMQNVDTRDVSLTGACVTGVTAQVTRGEIIGLQYGPEKARFRVMWVRQENGSTFNLGLSCADEGKCLWMPSLAVLDQPHDYTGKNDRRAHPRFQCNGSAQISEAGKGLRMWGTITDLSAGGCYVQTVSNMPVGTNLDVALSVDKWGFTAKAQVRTSHPNIGMGMQFLSLTPENQKKMEELLEKLDAKLASTLPSSIRALKQIEIARGDLNALEARLRQDTKQGMKALEKLARMHADMQELLEDSPPNKPPK